MSKILYVTSTSQTIYCTLAIRSTHQREKMSFEFGPGFLGVKKP